MISAGLGLLIGSIISGIAAAGANIYTANSQKAAQEEANQTNIQLANEANEAQLQAVRETNEFNAAQAQIDRDRQDTTMQRAMADYSAAGLNPLMAVSSGAGYSSPTAASGNVAQIQKAQVQPAALDFSGMASAFSSMSNAMLINAMFSKSNDVKEAIANANNLSRQSIAALRASSSEKIAKANNLSRQSIASARNASGEKVARIRSNTQQINYGHGNYIKRSIY